MFATTNPKEPNAAPNVPANITPCPDGRDYDTLDDLERCRAEENRLQEARGKGAPTPDPQVRVLVRGDQRSYVLKERLKAAGMRWMPSAHAWSGVVPESFVSQMEVEGLQTIPLVPEGHPIDRFRESFVEKALELPSPNAPARKQRARARNEAPVKVSPPQERVAGFLQEHGWDARDITANLSDDGRAEDERRVERHLRDLRTRVKAVRAKIAADPTIRRTLATCPEKAAAFYAIHGVTEAQVRHGVPGVNVTEMEWDDLVSVLHGSLPWEPVNVDWTGEAAQRAAATLPEVVA